jgi:hypothetical protein
MKHKMQTCVRQPDKHGKYNVKAMDRRNDAAGAMQRPQTWSSPLAP